MASNFASVPAIILHNVRLQWGDLFTPAAMDDNGKPGVPKFKAVGLFAKDSDAMAVARKGLVDAATAMWGGNAMSVIPQISSNSKFVRDGNSKLMDDGSVRPEFKDLFFVSCSNKQRPQIIAPKKHNGQWVTITEAGRGMVNGIDVTDQLGYAIKVPYRGCYVNLKLQPIAGKQFQTPDGKTIPNQVYAKLEAVQFVGDGEAFGAGPTSAEGFGEEAVDETTVDANALF